MRPFLSSYWMWIATAALLWSTPLRAQDSAAEAVWRDRAVSEFPELGVKDSPLNKSFVSLVKQLRERAPQYFSDPTWPYKLAKTASTREVPAELKTVERDPALIKRLQEYCAAALKEGIRRKEITGDMKRFNEADGSLRWGAWGELLLLSEKYIPDTEEAMAQFIHALLANPSGLKEVEQYWLALFLATPQFQKWVEGSVAERLKLVVQLLPLLGEPGEVLAWIKGEKSHSYNGTRVSYSENSEDWRFKVLEFILRQRLQLGEVKFTPDQIIETAVEIKHWGVLFEISMEHWPSMLWAESRAPLQVANGMKSEEWREYFLALDALHQAAMAPKSVQEEAKPESGKKGEPGKAAEAAKVAQKPRFEPGLLEECLMWRCLRFDSPNEAAAWLNKVSQGLGTLSDKNAHESRRVFVAMASYFKGTWKTPIGIKK